MTSYEKSRVAVDAVIFTIHNGRLKVLLHSREKEPFISKLELPGGLLEKDETAEDALKRKLQEMLGRDDTFFTQFYTFTNPDRDPRERTVSIGFIALIDCDRIGDMRDWHTDSKNLAFDHSEIIIKAKEYLKVNISSLIVKQFMPKEFPLNKLQEAYEMIEEKRYDNRNFRKKMLSRGIVEETGKSEQDVSHRPAKLFRFT